MDFASFIYVDSYAYRKYKKLSKIISKRKRYSKDSFFVIVLNEYSSRIEFEEWFYLLQRHYEQKPPVLVGLAQDYDSAEKLCCRMIYDCISKVGKLDYVTFLSLLEAENGDSVKNTVLIKDPGGIV